MNDENTNDVKSVGKEIGPFRVNVRWADNVKMGDAEKQAAVELVGKITHYINGQDNASTLRDVVESITILPFKE